MASVLIGAVVIGGGLTAALAPLAFAAVVSPITTPTPVAARRVTESQYRHIIADVFGPEIKLNARFEPEKREDGLLAIGSTQLSITPTGFEQYYALARSIADQVLDPQRRDASVGCKPVDPKAADDACAAAFVRRYGDTLFRRPMTEAEVAARVATARKGGEAGDFYNGLKMALVSTLVAPQFLFRIEMAEPDPANPGKARLDAYTKASRISFLLWDSAPDGELMRAAQSGALQTEAGLKSQLDRMTASSRLQSGARAFFTDMLQFDGFDSLNKDAAIYPKYSQAVADSAKEETLRTLIDELIVKRGDYRDVFTSNETFINRPLAALYKVPFDSTGDWTPHTFPASSERSGILTQIGFLSLFSHPGRSSPTRRGVKLYEIFLCQPTPDPPANVDFSKVQDSTKGTVRGRLTDHMTNEGCAMCHRRSDPAGLTLEHFDSAGQLRTMENGSLIDVSGEINGVKLLGAQGLGQMIHANPAVSACLVRDIYYYGVGRAVDDRDDDYLAGQSKAFAASGYRLPDLYKQIVASPQFFKVVMPARAKTPTPPVKVAMSDAKSIQGGSR